MEDEIINARHLHKSILTGRETLNELKVQKEILEFSENTLQEAEELTKEAIHKVRGMTWWGSFLNLFSFNFSQSKKKRSKKVVDLEQGINGESNNIDEMLDIALTMNKILKNNNESIDRIEIKIDKVDDDFINLKKKMNDLL
jgi:hypothetical protein